MNEEQRMMETKTAYLEILTVLSDHGCTVAESKNIIKEVKKRLEEFSGVQPVRNMGIGG